MRRTVSLFRIIFIILSVVLIISMLGGYVFLRVKGRGNETIFIPPSQKYIEKTFIEKYGKSLVEIAEFALLKEDFRWYDNNFKEDPDYYRFVKIDGEYFRTQDTFPVIEHLYNEGLEFIVLTDNDVQFSVWTDMVAYNAGFIYSKTGEFDYSYKNNVTFKKIDDTENWYYYVYAFER